VRGLMGRCVRASPDLGLGDLCTLGLLKVTTRLMVLKVTAVLLPSGDYGFDGPQGDHSIVGLKVTTALLVPKVTVALLALRRLQICSIAR
jgi:hypothetical protein